MNERTSGFRHALFLVLLMLSTLAPADTVYKSVGPDGKIVYSDKPPEDDGKLQKTMEIRNLPATPLPDAVLRYREQVMKSMKTRLADSGKPNGSAMPVLFSAQWCGYCKKAKAYLAAKNIAYQENDIDTPSGMQAMVAAGLSGGIPILLLDHGRKLRGFSKEAYDGVFGG